MEKTVSDKFNEFCELIKEQQMYLLFFMTRRNNMYLIRNRNGGKVCREHA